MEASSFSADLCNGKLSLIVHSDLLLFRCIKDLQNFTAERILIEASLLKHLLNIPQLSEIEFSLTIQRVIIHLQFTNLIL